MCSLRIDPFGIVSRVPTAAQRNRPTLYHIFLLNENSEISASQTWGTLSPQGRNYVILLFSPRELQEFYHSLEVYLCMVL